MELTERQLDETEAALRGPEGERILDLMCRIGSHESLGAVPPSARSLVHRLGWFESPDLERPTPLGWLVADPLREYVHWNARSRQVHWWTRCAALTPGTFHGKSVVELGSGVGCNLFSLQGVAREVVGVEIEPLYKQMTPIIARLAETAAPEIIIGSSDAVPLPDARFDRVVCFGALQLMPLEGTIREASRLLVPGGLAMFGLSDFPRYFRHRAELLKSEFSLKRLAKESWTALGALTYPLLGRRLVPKGAPVHPFQTWMERWFEEAGLVHERALQEHIDHEVLWVARKR